MDPLCTRAPDRAWIRSAAADCSPWCGRSRSTQAVAMRWRSKGQPANWAASRWRPPGPPRQPVLWILGDRMLGRGEQPPPASLPTQALPGELRSVSCPMRARGL